MYGRVKNLLKLEDFHAKSVNGVMREIFANLLVMSIDRDRRTGRLRVELKLDPEVAAVPSFKNAQAVVKRHLIEAINAGARLTEQKSKRSRQADGRRGVSGVWKKQPGRCYPRVLKQPIKSWNLAKNKKLKDFANAQSS